MSTLPPFRRRAKALALLVAAHSLVLMSVGAEKQVSAEPTRTNPEQAAAKVEQAGQLQVKAATANDELDEATFKLRHKYLNELGARGSIAWAEPSGIRSPTEPGNISTLGDVARSLKTPVISDCMIFYVLHRDATYLKDQAGTPLALRATVAGKVSLRFYTFDQPPDDFIKTTIQQWILRAR